MKRTLIVIATLSFAGMLGPFVALADDNAFERFGRDVSNAGKEVGKTGKDVGKKIGKTGKQVGKGIADSAKDVGKAFSGD